MDNISNMKFIKRNFYNNRDYFIDMDQKVVKLTSSHHEKLLTKTLWNKYGFKKIGGSSIGDVLVTDNFKSQFKAFIRIAWLDMPILDKKYINAGIAIEPKVLSLLEKQSNIQEMQRFDPQMYEYDYFKNNDSTIGGIPDGIAILKNNVINQDKVLIEIKTTGVQKLSSWTSYGPPLAYHKQAQLYAYLLKINNYAIVATFLEDEDYLNPHSFDIENHLTRTWFHTIDINQVNDDIKKVKHWYQSYTSSGISPQFDEIKDADLIAYLQCETEQQWKELLNKWDLEGKINWDSLEQ